MTRLLPLLREYGGLERKRIQEGVTPLEYQRWLELERTLSKQIFHGSAPDGIERRRHLRVPTRMLVQFRTPHDLKDAVISNISRGGLFISTPFMAEIGSTFTLCIRVDSTGQSVDVPCEIVSRNMGSDLTTSDPGMGVKFVHLNAEQREAVDRLLAAALGHDMLEEFWDAEQRGESR
jgi:uncharacterized protein (TIGR02266 family)